MPIFFKNFFKNFFTIVFTICLFLTPIGAFYTNFYQPNFYNTEHGHRFGIGKVNTHPFRYISPIELRYRYFNYENIDRDRVMYPYFLHNYHGYVHHKNNPVNKQNQLNQTLPELHL